MLKSQHLTGRIYLIVSGKIVATIHSAQKLKTVASKRFAFEYYRFILVKLGL